MDRRYTKDIEVKIEISPKNKIHKDFKDLNSKIALSTDGLFPMLIQEKFITIIDAMSRELVEIASYKTND